MSTLIVQLPAQPRLTGQRADTLSARAAVELDYVLSADGLHVNSQGRCLPADLPTAQSVVAVLPADDAGWHRITAPKAPAARLRQALAGVLEEQLLEDDADLHLAVAPGLKAGEALWVAAISKGWLKAQLAAIEATGLTVDRLVPAWAPDGPPAAHVYRHETDSGDSGLRLAWRDADGAVVLPLDSDSARALLAHLPTEAGVSWTASPDTAAQAAELTGQTVPTRSAAELMLAAAGSAWNLRQFDLSPQHRGSRAARDALRHFLFEPTWRPVRLGLVLLLGLQLVGANLWAWQQRQALNQRKTAMVSLLQTTFPQVRGVRDAPVQMQMEVDRLRAAAGQASDTDLEPLLYAAQAAWPSTRGPAETISFEPGKLILGSTGWSAAETEGFQSRLRPLGLDARVEPGKLTLTRASLPLDSAPQAPAAGGRPVGAAGPGHPPPPPGLDGPGAAPRPPAPNAALPTARPGLQAPAAAASDDEDDE
jgi:general secretion pathway protein L